MGSIRSRADSGLLFLDFRYQGKRCREQTALPDSTANRRKLEKVLVKIEEEISLGSFDYLRTFPNSRNAGKLVDEGVPSGNLQGEMRAIIGMVAGGDVSGPLFKTFAETWYAEKQPEWRKSHCTVVRADLDRLLIPRFGERVVSQITKADILAYRAERAKVHARGKETVLSNRRINKILNPLRQILCEAADRFDFRMPFLNIKPLKTKRTDVEPFSLDEVKLILKSVRGDFRNYFTVRFFTGMRTGEVDGLKWKYVDFERNLILIRETVVAGEEGEPKTDESVRDIQMSQMVFDALKSQAAATRHLSEFVFCNLAGKPLAHRNVTQRVWYPLLRHLGLKLRRPYQCRHTAATLWLASGEAPEWIARQLGHTTTEMLFRVYSRYVPNLTRKDGSAFERLITGAIADKPLPTSTAKEVDHV